MRSGPPWERAARNGQPFNSDIRHPEFKRSAPLSQGPRIAVPPSWRCVGPIVRNIVAAIARRGHR